MQRSTLRRASRLFYIAYLVKVRGPMTPAQVCEFWRANCQGSTVRKPVTVATIRADLDLLAQQKKLVQVRSDKGHEMGGGRWVAYQAYKVAE